MIYSFEGKYAFLSNFDKSPIVDEHGIVYPTNEHFFQAMKTLNIAERAAIAAAPSPGKAKRMGRQVALRSDWEAIKNDVMLEGLRKKFADPKLAQKLLNTAEEHLVEGNTWHDNYWGICHCGRPSCGVGSNMLGNLLMQVRDELRGPDMTETEYE